MLSIEICKNTLEKHGANYSLDEIKRIREILYLLAELELNIFYYEKFM